jgi:glycosyltransferase involved in cell wall biosynthesis
MSENSPSWKKPRVAYWNLGPSPYAVERLNAVARRGNLQLEVWFNVLRIPGRTWHVRRNEWLFRAKVIGSSTLLGNTGQFGCDELRDFAPDLVVCGYDTPARAMGCLAARASGARVAFRILPSFRAWVKPSPAHELAKHFLFRFADGAKVSGPDAAAIARRYGMPANRIVTVRQSIDREHYANARHLRARAGRDLRHRLGLTGVVFVYVGRLWKNKGLDYLFEAYRQVAASRQNVSLLVVGDGPDEAAYRESMKHLPQCVFAGFVQRTDLPMYYAAADVMVFPTLGDPFGLVVEESMAAGLPIICTSSAGEIATRVPEGEAGYIVPPRDARAIAKRMLALIDEPDRRARMGEAAASLSTIVDHDTYANDFEAFADAILTQPKRSNLPSVIARLLGHGALELSRPSRVPRLSEPRDAHNV